MVYHKHGLALDAFCVCRRGPGEASRPGANLHAWRGKRGRLGRC